MYIENIQTVHNILPQGRHFVTQQRVSRNSEFATAKYENLRDSGVVEWKGKKMNRYA